VSDRTREDIIFPRVRIRAHIQTLKEVGESEFQKIDLITSHI
jgi:hypothetical protein